MANQNITNTETNSITDFVSNKSSNRSEDSDVVGIAGWTAIVRISESITSTSTSSSYYREDGSYASDHIIVDPIEINIEGQVDNLTYGLTTSNSDPTSDESTNGVGNVTQYQREVSDAKLARMEAIDNDIGSQYAKEELQIEKGNSSIGSFGNISGSSVKNTDGYSDQRRRAFIEEIRAYQQSREEITIEMHQGQTYKNMVITSFVTSEDNELDNTGFSITAVQSRYASELEATVTYKKLPSVQSENAVNNSVINKGSQEGEETENNSFLFSGGQSLRSIVGG